MGCRGCGGGTSVQKSTRTYCALCGTRLHGVDSKLPRIGGKIVCPKCKNFADKAKQLEKDGTKAMIAARKKNKEA